MKRQGRFEFCWAAFLAGGTAGAAMREVQTEWPAHDIWVMSVVALMIVYFFWLTHKAYKADENDR